MAQNIGLSNFKRLSFLIIALVSLFAPEVDTKVVSCKNKFSSGKDQDSNLWIYCTKFGAGKNFKTNIRSKAQFVMPYMKNSDETYKVQLGFYLDTDFLGIAEDNTETCEHKKSRAYKVVDLEIPANGDWGSLNVEYYYNLNVPMIYYFAVMDCGKQLHANDRKMPKINVEVELTSEDQRYSLGPEEHFAFEDKGTLSLHVYLLIIFVALFGYNVKSYIQYRKTFDRYDSPHFVVLVSLYMQMSAVFLHTIHLWLYSSNGYGFAPFDILGLICFMLAEIGVACLFMLFAYGWTLSFQDIDWDNNLEFYIPIGSIVLALHLVLGAMTYIDIDAYHKYHDFAGIQGFALVFLRLCLFGYYIYCFTSNKDKIPKRSQEIYRYFWLMGCVYFLIVPVTVLTSYMFQEYQRQYYYTLVTNCAQIVTAIVLLYQQSSTKTKYFKSSISGQGGILPMEKMR